MKRITATIAICIGIACIISAVLAHFDLRNLANSSTLVEPSEHLSFRILTAGILDQDGSSTIVAAAFVSQLKFRIFAIFSIGLTLILTGGLLRIRTGQIVKRSEPLEDAPQDRNLLNATSRFQ